MQVLYKSTRGKEQAVTCSYYKQFWPSETVSGLFVPGKHSTSWMYQWTSWHRWPYQETAYEVSSRFLARFTEDEAFQELYQQSIRTANLIQKKIAPLHEADGAYFEPFHGATTYLAIWHLPFFRIWWQLQRRRIPLRMRSRSLPQHHQGDTGKAAMAGFADAGNEDRHCIYPKHGVSLIQRNRW